MGEQGQPNVFKRWLPLLCSGQRPAPIGSSSRSCSRLNAHSKRDAVAGWGFPLRPFDFTGSSARNSAQE